MLVRAPADVSTEIAVPVPDPKKFTDEELAKIGIHMASRLHTDDTKGQSNWADIDEDDEDWDAPDAFTWSDGTKTTIPHIEETPAIPEPPVITETKAVEKPQSPAPPLIPVSKSPAVKPGLPSGKGLVLKGGASSEKPTLVAKPPAPPTPVKSPWAPLPPVSKASPMENAPDQPQRGFGSPSQAYVRGGPPPAAREIAADDFSRSPRRDHQQLFNSQSGRYEPVSRGTARPDYPQRQPAVLQRPMHSEGPAEPSAAFQTTHSSGNYGRRRGSSNVSGGSGTFQRPKFLDQSAPSETQDARRSSLISDGPIPPTNYSAPGPQINPQQSPYQDRASPAMSAIAPQQVPEAGNVAVPQPNIEDTVEFQKKLMQERRAEAIKRRQEQEAQEEAAKKERLAKKLAALGPPPERRGNKKEETQEAPKATSEQSIIGPEASQVADDAHPAKAITDNESSPTENGVSAGPQAASRSLGANEPPLATENKHGHPWVQPQIPPQPEPAIWGSGIQGPGAQGSRNVWGAPNNDRTLGNGSFNNGFDTQSSQTAATRGDRRAPGPIGRPKAAPPLSSHLGPIAPPRVPTQTQRPQNQNQNRWAAQVIADDNTFYTDANTRSAALERDLKARGLDHADVQPRIKEQYTELDEDRNALKRQVATYGSSTWSAPSVGRQDDRPGLASSQPAGRNGSATASQQSRFFPSQPEPLAPDTGRPPEEYGHPAFDGDARHPLVSLPPKKVSLPPKKVMVKLPPTASALNASQRLTSSQSTSGWGHDSTSGQASRAVTTTATTVSQEDEPLSAMERLHALLKDFKQPSSVNSSSRTAMAPAPADSAATVSLPVLYAPGTIVDNSSFVTKTMDEDCFEEQEMGSLPAVHIPSEIPEAAYNPAKAPPRQDRRLVQVVATSVDAFVFQPESRNTIVVYLPEGERKTVSVAVRSPNPRRGGRSGSRYGSSSSFRGGIRGQDLSTAYVAEQAPSSGSGSGISRGRGRGGFRGRGDWSRGSNPAVQT